MEGKPEQGKQKSTNPLNKQNNSLTVGTKKQKFKEYQN